MTDRRKIAVAVIIAALAVTTTAIVLYPHSIEVEIEGEGTVTPSDGSVRFYQDIEFSLEPAAGWYVGEVTLDGKDVEVVDGKVTVSASALELSTMRLKVTFVQGSPEDVRSLTVRSNEGGSTDPHGTVEYAKGTTVSVSIAPDEGYGISGITVDGKAVGAVDELSVTMDSDHVVEVTFAPVQMYTITASAGSGGSISPSGPVEVRAGEDITFTARAHSDYSVSYLMVDGKRVSGKTSYTFSDVGSDHTISVVFRYTGGSGPVTPSEPTLERIEVARNPDRMAYTVGQTFDPTGMVIRATYSDGSTRDISSGYSFSPTGPLGPEDTEITVTYGGKSVDITITVTDPVQSISVTTPPARTSYSVGDRFDPTGMVVTATYASGRTETVSGYGFSPMMFTEAGGQKVTISYEGKTCTQDVSVTSGQSLTVSVTSYRGTMVDASGNIVRFDDDGVPYGLNDLHTRTEGIVPGIEQTIRLKVTNDGGTDLHAFVFVKDLVCDGYALADQIFLSSGTKDVSISSANAETVTSENAFLDLGTISGGQFTEFELTLSFPSSSDNNDAMGETISFNLGVFASEDSP